MLSDQDNAEISKLDPALPVKLQTQSFDLVSAKLPFAGDTEVLDQTDLAAIATMPADNITLLKLIASGEIQSTPSDPTGTRRFHEHWRCCISLCRG